MTPRPRSFLARLGLTIIGVPCEHPDGPQPEHPVLDNVIRAMLVALAALVGAWLALL